jgi:DNA repair exonuclease SbcCD ATPase subunit
MIEVDLDEFEEFYNERINEKYYKIKKVAQKMISDVRENLVEIKLCMDHFLDAGEDKIDKKAVRSLHYFSDKIKKEIDEIEIPDDRITFKSLYQLLNSLKKLFNSINDIARKSLPKFGKQVQAEIKELDYLTRKLGKKQRNLDKFLRKKYLEVKEAEDVLDKLPKFYTLKENIENAKSDVEEFKAEKEEIESKLNEFNQKLLELEKNELFQKLEQYKDELFKLKLKVNGEISFKKALKKMKVEIEKENIYLTNINLNYIRDFIKNPVRILSNEDKDLQKYSSMLVQLRHALEEDKLNLKSDKKEKALEQINHFFDEREIQEDIDRVKELKNKIKTYKQKIKDAGLSGKLEEVKDKISLYTVKLEHIENDINRRNKDYLRYLASLKKEREEFQNQVEDIIEEEVKVTITFTF